MVQPPKLDRRTAAHVAEQVKRLLPKYVRGWAPPPHLPPTGPSEALIQIFARFCGHIIQRMNKAPEKNFLAFMDLLGVSPLPPQPARVPLTFYLSAQRSSTVVPALTQVAAQPAEGEEQPCIFETEDELAVTSAKLDALFVKNSVRHEYADYSLTLGGHEPPSGQVTASFEIQATGLTRQRKVTLTATGGECPPANRSPSPKVMLSSLILLPTSIKASTTLTGAVVLNAPAPEGGVLVFLGTDDSGCQIPISVMVLPRQTTAAFTVETSDSPGVPAFRGRKPIPHTLYFGLKLPSTCTELKELRLSLAPYQVASAQTDPRPLEWEIVWGRCLPPPSDSLTDDEVLKALPVKPSSDGTENFTKTGDVVFTTLPLWTETVVDGVTSRWLRCRRLPSPVQETRQPGNLPSGLRLPPVKVAAVHVEVERKGLRIERAFVNNLPLDLTKEFFPFGEKPKFGDTLYVSNSQAFSTPGAQVTFHFKLTNPASAGVNTPIAAAAPRDTRLRWEFWDGESWLELGVSAPIRFPDETTQFSDTTSALSISGEVAFRFPKPPQPTTISGQTNFWIRVRIISGDYGREAHYERVPNEKDPNKGYFVVPSTLAPPCISSVQVDYAVKSDSQPEAVLTYDDFTYVRGEAEDPRAGKPTINDPPALYFGFVPPANGLPANFCVSLYLGTSNTPQSQGADDAVPDSTGVVWEYWSALKQSWARWTVRDDTRALRRSGLIRFLVPPDFSPRQEFGRERYWLRARKAKAEDDTQPRLQCVLLNTTLARQAVSSVDEVLGSSNGKRDQTFRVTRAPLLDGQQLEVIEPMMPPADEQVSIKREEGAAAIRPVVDPVTGRREFKVQWHEVPNFYGSEPRDRHYRLDRATGEVKFGDGRNGLIPPVLAGNIRMGHYQTGGGAVGNRPRMSITQLKTTVPYIEKVTNWEAATGGADAEGIDAVLECGPREVRHGRRAVTVEDFEDLAMLASPAVARAKCVPLYDLSRDPGACKPEPGLLSVIIVPRSTDSKPLASLELFERVREFLDAHRTLTFDFVLVNPQYVRIQVNAEIALTSLDAANDIEVASALAVSRFLHPLTGRPDGKGWAFGRRPAESDLYELLQGIPGVSHVRSLVINEEPESRESERSNLFLIYGADRHEITLTLEE